MANYEGYQQVENISSRRTGQWLLTLPGMGGRILALPPFRR
jgi:hypothetical protein